MDRNAEQLARQPWSTPELRTAGAETTELNYPAPASDGTGGYASFRFSQV